MSFYSQIYFELLKSKKKIRKISRNFYFQKKFGFYIENWHWEDDRAGIGDTPLTWEKYGSIVIKSPILIGIICGIIYSATGIPFPIFLDQIMMHAANMVFALALICVGVFLANHSLVSCGWVQFIFCMVVRILIGPFFALLWCMALKLPPRVARQCVIIGLSLIHIWRCRRIRRCRSRWSPYH